MKKILLATGLLIAFGFNAIAQEEKKVVYEFTVHHLNSAADAQYLDSMMLKKKGILECQTDFVTGRITVKVISAVDFQALRNIVVANGFEASEENLVRKEEN
ncbi:MAG: heavy metal-associated domain-containing protein [Bacteroidota bacterium]